MTSSNLINVSKNTSRFLRVVGQRGSYPSGTVKFEMRMKRGHKRREVALSDVIRTNENDGLSYKSFPNIFDTNGSTSMS